MSKIRRYTGKVYGGRSGNVWDKIKIRHSCVHVLIKYRGDTVIQRKRSEKVSRQEQQCPRRYIT